MLSTTTEKYFLNKHALILNDGATFACSGPSTFSRVSLRPLKAWFGVSTFTLKCSGYHGRVDVRRQSDLQVRRNIGVATPRPVVEHPKSSHRAPRNFLKNLNGSHPLMQQLRSVVENCGDAWMVRPQPLLINLLCPHVQQLSRQELSLSKQTERCVSAAPTNDKKQQVGASSWNFLSALTYIFNNSTQLLSTAKATGNHKGKS